MDKIREVADKIALEYQPEKIILFGSFAWGTPNKDSDIDLFIVKETENAREAMRDVHRLFWGRSFAMDILVYDPKNVEKRIQMGDPFVSDILNKGKLLYERK